MMRVLLKFRRDVVFDGALNRLFADQSRWARASDPTDALRQLGRLGGLKAEQIDACLADKAGSLIFFCEICSVYKHCSWATFCFRK